MVMPIRQTVNLCSLYLLEICIRFLGVKDLVAVHDRDKIFSFREVDDVMRIAWQHMDALDIVTRHFKINHLIGAEFAFLNQAMTGHDDEEFPLGVVPVLAFGDAGLGDVDADLTTIQSVNQLRERTTVIHIHLQRESNFLFGQVAEICAIELLCKRVGRNLRDH